jgi:outer membrane protein OmpA-like peptidoglycan-associated protein
MNDLWEWLRRIFGWESTVPRPELTPERPQPPRIPPRPPIVEDHILPPLPGTIEFAYNSSTLNPEQVVQLRCLAQYLISHPRASIELIGRTDPVGSPNFNAGLGAMRAEVVARQLMNFHVPVHQIRRVHSTGEQDVIRDHATASAFRLYRNVTVRLIGAYR